MKILFLRAGSKNRRKQEETTELKTMVETSPESETSESGKYVCKIPSGKSASEKLYGSKKTFGTQPICLKN